MADNRDTSVRFKAGELIIQEKYPSGCMYIIKEGQVKVFRKGKDGQEIPLAIVNSGQYLGELALLKGHPHSSNAVALTDVVAVKISKEAIDAQLKQAPTWMVALLKSLVDRLQATNEILRKNGVVDENLASTLKAVQDNSKKAS